MNSEKKAAENMNLWAESESPMPPDVADISTLGNFSADSAYRYLVTQVSFGPRVPNTEAHRVKIGRAHV